MPASTLTISNVLTSQPYKTSCTRSPSGRIETLYIGAKTSHNSWRIYDKAKQAKLPGCATRIERKSTTAFLLKELKDFQNPFVQLTLVDLVSNHTIPPVDPLTWSFFKEAARHEPIPSLLGKLPKKQRKHFRMALKQAPVSWWQPEDIWNHWPKLLSVLAILGGGA